MSVCEPAKQHGQEPFHWGEGITAEDMKALRWVKPTVVVEVGFVEWTADALMRHSTFVGIRDDKRPSDVGRTA